MLTKYCNGCKIEKSADDFYTKKVGNKEYRFSQCKVCRLAYDRERRKTYKRSAESIAASNEKMKEKFKEQRAAGIEREKFIVMDSRRSDQRYGRQCDLDREFVRDQIAKPCFWCDDTESQMTLDRLDNSIGHLKTNVVPSCYRCNLIRRDMPQEAWNYVRQGVRDARVAGAFGAWMQNNRAFRGQISIVGQ